MVYTKGQASIAAGATLTAGGGTTVYPTGVPAYINLDDWAGAGVPALTASLYLRLTNGATGPTVPADIQIEVSTDASSWYNFGGLLVGGTNNNQVVEWGGIELPDSTRFVRITAGNNTAQNVTLDAAIDAIYDT